MLAMAVARGVTRILPTHEESQPAMSTPMIAVVVAVFVGLGTMVMLELGRIVGLRRRRRNLEPGSGGAIEGAVFAIFGLLVAFTFSGAASRFESRRALINDEVNAIGTAWLRFDLLPAEKQPAIRDEMRRYLDERLSAYAHAEDQAAVIRGINQSQQRQAEIWRLAIIACRSDPLPTTTTLVLPAINDAFDVAGSRLAATTNHPPTVIFMLLVAMALVCAFLAGNGLASEQPNRIHAVGFAMVIALVVYVILDLEFPRLGFIRIDDADQQLIDLRASMGVIKSL